MKILLRILMVTLGIICCSPTLYGLYNAQGGHQGIRQQVASNSEVFTTILDVNFSTVDAQLSVIETQNVVMRSVLDGVDSQCEVVGSKVDVDDIGIVSQLDVIESKIGLPSCAATPITTTTTISTSGAYCLANNITGGLSITGTSIMLDLAGYTISGGTYGITISGDDVTVRNGTIKNAINANMLLTGNQCLIESCDVIGSITGIQLNNATRNRLSACCAMNNSAAGFSLAQSFSNNVVGCQVISTSGSGNVYGFTSQNGAQNLFEDCSAQGISSRGAQAVGYGLYAENADTILASKALSVLSSTGFAQGMFLGIDSSLLTMVTGQAYGNAVVSVNWSPDGRYLAVGGSIATSGNQLQIYAFNGGLLTTVTGQVYGDSVLSVNWSPNGQYLAVGGFLPTSGNEIQIYAFNGSLLTTVTGKAYGMIVRSVNWSPDGQYLAVGGSTPTSGNEIQVYSFNGSALTLTTSQDYGSNVFSVNWSPDGRYLAVGGSGATSGNKLQIYAFNGSLLTTVTGQVYGTVINSVNWSSDGQYLAVGGQAPASGNEIQIFSFNGSVLTLVASQDYGTRVLSVNWFPGALYLAVAGNTPNQVQVYSFSGSSLTLMNWYGSVTNSVNWSPDGRYLAAGGSAVGDRVQIFNGINNCLNCILQNNLVSGVHNAANTGVGYSVNACNNLFMGNTAYANDTDYQFTTSCIGDNIYSQLDVIESKIDASGMPAMSQLNSIESKLGVCCTALDSQLDRLESKLDTADAYIISKLDVSCAPTVITTTTTISTSGAYCLANNINGGLSITGTSITLDLSGRTISGGTYGIAISGDDVTVRNGTIKNATNANMLLTGNQCLIEACDVIGSITGIQLNNATRNRLAACCAMNNSAAGFSLAQSSSNSIVGCQVISTSGSGNVYGFTSQNGAQNLFENCSAENIASSGAQAIGYGLYSDYADVILASKALSVVSSTSNFADGMLLGMTYSSLVTVTGQVYGTRIYSVNWSPNGQYVVVGGEGATSSNQLQIYAFNGSLLTMVTGQVYGTYIQSVNWSPNGQYVAVGGQSSLATGQLQIYAFNGSLLRLVTEQKYGYYIYSVNWSPNGQYLAVGGYGPTSGNQVQIYSFGADLLTTVTGQVYATGFNSVYSVNWSSDGRYLAVGGTGAISGNQFQVYAFNGSALSFVDGKVYGTTVNSVDWSPDGRYVAVGGQSASSGNQLQIYAFNGSLLTKVAEQVYGSIVLSVNWSPDGRYLMVGGYKSSGNTFEVYAFDGGGLLTLVTSQAFGQTLYSVNWSPNGQYMVAGGFNGTAGNQLQIFRGFNNCSKCILKDNLVSGVHNALPGGVGYLVDACNNLFVGNTAYANDIDNAFTTACTGDNIYSQLDVIEAKLACVPQSITSAGTIATPGVYCLANSINGDLMITATNVTLDLNGYTINATTTGVTVLGNNVVIKNGIILGGSRAGVWLNGAFGCDLSGITCSNATYYGFILTDSANNNRFTQCNTSKNTYAGFYLYQSHSNNFSACSAKTIGVIGFCCDKSDYNIFSSCEAIEIYGNYISPLPTPPGGASSNQNVFNQSCGFLIYKATGVVVDSCQAKNIRGDGTVWRTTGIELFQAEACVVNNCSIFWVWNAFINNYGIDVDAGKGHIITGNTVNNKGYAKTVGIYYVNGVTNSIFSNNSSINSAIYNWFPYSGFISGSIYGIRNVPTPA